jgi:hypothetical protein
MALEYSCRYAIGHPLCIPYAQLGDGDLNVIQGVVAYLAYVFFNGSLFLLGAASVTSLKQHRNAKPQNIDACFDRLYHFTSLYTKYLYKKSINTLHTNIH